MQVCSLQSQSQHPKKSMAASHSSTLRLLFLLFATQTIITSTPLFASPSPQQQPNADRPPLHPPLPPNSPFPTPSSPPLPPPPISSTSPRPSAAPSLPHTPLPPQPNAANSPSSTPSSPPPTISSTSPPTSAAPSLPHTPLPPQPIPTNSPSPIPSSPPPPPPPPIPISATSPPPSSTAQEQLNNIIDALIGAGDFNTWSNILSDAGSSTLPLSATLFIPADDSPPHPLLTTITIDPFIFPYHMVPQRLSFSDLRLLPPCSRLPTLLPAKTILITNTSVTNFTLDDTLLSHPDLYTTPAVAVHGIATLLDYNRYGDAKGLATSTTKPSPEVIRPPAPPDNIQETLLPPGMFMPSGEVVGARKSDAACLCREFPVVFSVVCGFLALKIHRYLLAR